MQDTALLGHVHPEMNRKLCMRRVVVKRSVVDAILSPGMRRTLNELTAIRVLVNRVEIWGKWKHV